jgi:hypothetical protein
MKQSSIRISGDLIQAKRVPNEERVEPVLIATSQTMPFLARQFYESWQGRSTKVRHASRCWVSIGVEVVLIGHRQRFVGTDHILVFNHDNPWIDGSNASQIQYSIPSMSMDNRSISPSKPLVLITSLTFRRVIQECTNTGG